MATEDRYTPERKSEFTGERDNEIFFRFRCECEDCDADGEIALLKSDGNKPFNCPEGCGAVYVPFLHGLGWKLKCVVLPKYFPREEQVL